MVLRWRQPAPTISTCWRGPTGEMLAAVARAPEQPIAAIIGPPGPNGGAASSYEQIFSAASTLWTVNHNLNRWPSAVTVLTVGGVEVDADVTHVSVNQLTVSFAVPVAGIVRII